MAAITPIISSLSFYKYEPFSNVFTSDVGHTLQFSNSSVELLPFLTQTDSRTVTLEGTFNRSFTYPLSLVLGTVGTAPNVTSTTTITVGVGRFNPPVQGQVYQLYQYENISNTFGSNPPITTVLPITTLVSVPSLPPGISIVSSNYTGQSFNLTGTPVLQQAQSNYKLIGTDSPGSGVVTVDIAIKVNAPRVVITPSSVSVTGMLIGTPITPVIFTAIQPNDNGPTNNFQYAWTPELPDGFSFVNASNVPITSFQYVNPTLPIQLIGTPTVTTANTFVAGGNPYFITLRGYHTTPASQQIIATSVISLSFAETVLVSASIPNPLYENKVLSPTDVVITGRTYFPLGSPIATLTKDALPPGLTLSTPIIAGSLFLEGTPTPASSGTYTFTATNSNGVSRSLAVPITVNANVVTFGTPTPANGASVTFIVSRPLSLETPGFYDKDIRFSATSTSGSSITYSSSLNFAIYGITFSTSTGTLTGVPTSFLTATPVTITATDTLGTSASQIFNVTITPDLFTFPTPAPTFTFFQNRPITPYQFVVTTLSGRIIQSFSGTMPPGLVLSATGLLSGTFTGTVGNTFTVTASTGYQAPPTASQTYSYTARPDNLLLLQENASDVITPLFSNIQFRTLQYSTDQFINSTYSVTTYPAEFPSPVLTLTSSGLLSGDFTQGELYPTYLLDVTTASAGVTTTSPVVITFTNPSTSILLAGCGVTNLSFTKPKVVTTTDLVFTATPDGSRQSNNQQWIDNFPLDLGYPEVYRTGQSYYPQLAQYNDTFVAVSPSNVYGGTYNPTTRTVDWLDIPVSTQGPESLAGYYNVATNGAGQYVVLQVGGDGSGPRVGTAYVYRLTVPGFNSTLLASVGPQLSIDSGPETALAYINGRYVFAQTRDTDGRPHVSVGTDDGTNIIWMKNEFADAPEMCNIMQFAVSNASIVAVGSFKFPTPGGSIAPGDSNKVPISISTNFGSNWTSPSTDADLRGSTLFDIKYAANTWVTCGYSSNGSNIIAYSTNLTNWSIYSSNDTTIWSSLSFNGNAWTVAGVSATQSVILSLAASPWPNQATSVALGTIPFIIGETLEFSRIVSATIPNTSPSVGSIFIPQNAGLSFVEPVQPNFTLYQYVPYTFRVQATGSGDFIFYYAANVPIGFTFIQDPTGTFATLSGTSPSNLPATVTLYAKTGNNAAVSSQLTLNTIIPYFTRPQSGAGAYTAIVRKHVDADAAQNARDSKVYPVVNPLAGPFMAPRAPDVVTMSNCFLGLCKKPCPSCHTMM